MVKFNLNHLNSLRPDGMWKFWFKNFVVFARDMGIKMSVEGSGCAATGVFHCSLDDLEACNQLMPGYKDMFGMHLIRRAMPTNWFDL